MKLLFLPVPTVRIGKRTAAGGGENKFRRQRVVVACLPAVPQAKRGVFLFRNDLPYSDMGVEAVKYSEACSKDADAGEKSLKLQALKTRIRKQFPGQCFDYQAAWDGKTFLRRRSLVPVRQIQSFKKRPR